MDISGTEVRRDIVAAALSDEPTPATVVRAHLARGRRTRWHYDTVRRDLHVLAARGRARRVRSGWVADHPSLLP